MWLTAFSGGDGIAWDELDEVSSASPAMLGPESSEIPT